MQPKSLITHTHMFVCICVCVYKHVQRDKEKEREREETSSPFEREYTDSINEISERQNKYNLASY